MVKWNGVNIGRKAVKHIKLNVGRWEIGTMPYQQYLEVTIDSSVYRLAALRCVLYIETEHIYASVNKYLFREETFWFEILSHIIIFDPECSTCGDDIKEAPEHVFFSCPRMKYIR